MVGRVVMPLLGMLLLCTGLGVAPLGAPRLHVARTPMQPRVAVARMVSPTTPIDYTFLNETVFARGIEKAKGTKLINVLAAAEYYTTGDLLAANPETFRSSLHNIGVVGSYQNTLCNWQTKELQARDRPLPGPTCTLDSRPGRPTPLSVSRAQGAKPRPCLHHATRPPSPRPMPTPSPPPSPRDETRLHHAFPPHPWSAGFCGEARGPRLALGANIVVVVVFTEFLTRNIRPTG